MGQSRTPGGSRLASPRRRPMRSTSRRGWPARRPRRLFAPAGRS